MNPNCLSWSILKIPNWLLYIYYNYNQIHSNRIALLLCIFLLFYIFIGDCQNVLWEINLNYFTTNLFYQLFVHRLIIPLCLQLTTTYRKARSGIYFILSHVLFINDLHKVTNTTLKQEVVIEIMLNIEWQSTCVHLM